MHAAEVTDTVQREAHEEAQRYRGGADRPLGGYVLVMSVFASLIAGAIGLAAATGRRVPHLSPFDVLVLAMGTHKLSRLITKDAVTSPLRAPFTRYRESGGPAEVMEEVRTTSQLRHTVGEMVSCPFCLDAWIASGFALGLVFAPKATRLVAGALAALTGADFLQLAYAKAQQAAG